MRGIIVVPFKEHSERVLGKNFVEYKGKPLYRHMLDTLSKMDMPVSVDTESDKVKEIVQREYPHYQIHDRPPEFSENWANGNHILTQFVYDNLDYDFYVQAFLTAPQLSKSTITGAINQFIMSYPKYDSLFTVTKETGLYWFNDSPVNHITHSQSGLPRTQDAPIMKETTGLYIISKPAILENGCRIGKSPYFFEVDSEEAVDIDTYSDLKC